MSRRLIAAILATAVTAIASCSGDTSKPALSDAAARRLQADVLAVTRAAAAHTWTTAATALRTLRTDLDAARSAGTVSAARATSIQSAIAAVSTDLAAASAPTTTPKTVPPTPTPTPTSTPPTTPTPQPKSPTKPGKHGGHDGGGKGSGDG